MRPTSPYGAAHDDIQALIVSGFKSLRVSRATLVDFGTADPGILRTWLQGLLSSVAFASRIDDRKARLDPVLQLAFSHDGLMRLRPELGQSAGFGATFSEGMTDKLRHEALGDDTAAHPGGNVWRGTRPVFDDPLPDTPCAHLLMLLYATDDGTLAAEAARLPSLPAGAAVVREIDTWLASRPSGHPRADPSDRALIREHFGFVDALSQPVPVPNAVRRGPSDVAAGDLVFGFPNAYGDMPLGATLAPGDRGYDRLADAGRPLRSFSANGSFLVVRELAQDVRGFWADMAAEAARLGALGGPVKTDLDLAQRVIGRSLDGTISKQGAFPPRGANAPGNDFGFVRHDKEGLSCPLGSHIRRANPRDSALPPHGSEKDRTDLIRSVNNHRVLRRGRLFGPPAADPTQADDQPRGLFFIAAMTDIARQFELIVRSWLLNPSFAALDGEYDPLTGPATQFSIQGRPARQRAQLKPWVRLVGGDYYFLPGRGALRALCA